MSLTEASFTARLDNGKSCSCQYTDGTREGLVQVWRYGDKFILTWEECLSGRQYDESEYTRDDRHEFETSTDLLEFVKEQNLDLSDFNP